MQGDLLRAQVLLDRHRVVGAALDGRVVGDDHELAPGDDADAGDDPRAGRVAVVELLGGQRRQLEERRAGVAEPLDAVARQQLAARDVALARPLAAAARDARQARSRSASSARCPSRLRSRSALMRLLGRGRRRRQRLAQRDRSPGASVEAGDGARVRAR